MKILNENYGISGNLGGYTTMDLLRGVGRAGETGSGILLGILGIKNRQSLLWGGKGE